MFFKKKERDFEEVCRLCTESKILDRDDVVLCGHNGIVSCTYSCKKFKYDLLKRIPVKRIKMSGDILSSSEEE